MADPGGIDWRAIVAEHFSGVPLHAHAEADLLEELAQHLEDRYRELRSTGLASEEAKQQTLLELGDVSPILQGIRRNQRMPKAEPVQPGTERGGSVLADLWRDLRYAARTMRQNSLFTLFVIVTLGLGIGANTTVFTVVNTLVLNPLPLKDPSSLAGVSELEAKQTGEEPDI
jgi:hypothetical protein